MSKPLAHSKKSAALLFKPNDLESSHVASDRYFANKSELSLGGYFYDYLMNLYSDVIGIRYYIDDSNRNYSAMALEPLMGDPRVSLDVRQGHIDILFSQKSIENHLLGQVVVNSVQDFGGVHVVEVEGLPCLHITLSWLE